LSACSGRFRATTDHGRGSTTMPVTLRQRRLKTESRFPTTDLPLEVFMQVNQRKKRGYYEACSTTLSGEE